MPKAPEWLMNLFKKGQNHLTMAYVYFSGASPRPRSSASRKIKKPIFNKLKLQDQCFLVLFLQKNKIIQRQHMVYFPGASSRPRSSASRKIRNTFFNKLRTNVFGSFLKKNKTIQRQQLIYVFVSYAICKKQLR
jgi:hypothetical protein